MDDFKTAFNFNLNSHIQIVAKWIFSGYHHLQEVIGLIPVLKRIVRKGGDNDQLIFPVSTLNS